MTTQKTQKPSLAQKALTVAGIGAATGALLFGGKKLLGRKVFKGTSPSPQMKPATSTPLLPAPATPTPVRPSPAAPPPLRPAPAPNSLSLKKRRQRVREDILVVHQSPHKDAVIKKYKELKAAHIQHLQDLKNNVTPAVNEEDAEDRAKILDGIKHLIPKEHR